MHVIRELGRGAKRALSRRYLSSDVWHHGRTWLRYDRVVEIAMQSGYLHSVFSLVSDVRGSRCTTMWVIHEGIYCEEGNRKCVKFVISWP